MVSKHGFVDTGLNKVNDWHQCPLNIQESGVEIVRRYCAESLLFKILNLFQLFGVESDSLKRKHEAAGFKTHTHVPIHCILVKEDEPR